MLQLATGEGRSKSDTGPIQFRKHTKGLAIFVEGVSMGAGVTPRKAKKSCGQAGLTYVVTVKKRDDAKILTKYRFSDFPRLHSLHIQKAAHRSDSFSRITFHSPNRIIIAFEPNLFNWGKGFSYIDYRNAFSKIVSENAKTDLRPQFTKTSMSFSISLALDFENRTLQELIGQVSRIYGGWRKQIERTLSMTFLDNKLLTAFNFPKQIKVACKQYLLYFGQFRKESGSDLRYCNSMLQR